MIPWRKVAPQRGWIFKEGYKFFLTFKQENGLDIYHKNTDKNWQMFLTLYAKYLLLICEDILNFVLKC